MIRVYSFLSILLTSVLSHQYTSPITIESDDTFTISPGDIIQSDSGSIRLELQSDDNDLVLYRARISGHEIIWSLNDDGGVPKCPDCSRAVNITSEGEIIVIDNEDTVSGSFGFVSVIPSVSYSFHVSNEEYMYLTCDEFTSPFSGTVLTDPMIVWIAGNHRSGRSQSHSFLGSVSTTSSQNFEFVNEDKIYSVSGDTKLEVSELTMTLTDSANTELWQVYDEWLVENDVDTLADICCISYQNIVGCYCAFSLSTEGSIIVAGTNDHLTVIETQNDNQLNDGYSLVVGNEIAYIETNIDNQILWYSDTIECDKCIFEGQSFDYLLCHHCGDYNYLERSSTYFRGNGDASACHLDIPGFDTSTNSYETAQGMGNVAIGVLGAAGAVFAPAGGLAAIIATGFAVADLFGSGDGLTDAEIFSTVGDMFTQSWVCMQDYVQQELETLRTQIFNTCCLSRTSIAIGYVDTYITDLGNDDTNEEKWDEIAGVWEQLDDVVDQFQFQTTEPSDCRALIPFIHLAMDQRVMVMSMYTYLSHFAEDSSTERVDWDSDDFTVKDLDYSNDFRLGNVYLMEKYLFCSGEAYLDILTNSDTLTLNQIKQEIDLLFDGDVFCAWIEATDMWGNMEQGTDFGDTVDFTQFSDCNSEIIMHYVLGGLPDTTFQETSWIMDEFVPYSPGRHESYEKIVKYGEREDKNEGEYCDGGPSASYGWRIDDQSACDDSYTEIDGSIDLYFGQLEQRTVWMKNTDNGCNSDCGIFEDYVSWERKETTLKCPANRQARGARYMIEYVGNYTEPTIAGLQILCTTSVGLQNDWITITSVGFDYTSAIQYNYEWSPYVICPEDSYLGVKIAAMQCTEDTKLADMQNNGVRYCTEYWRHKFYGENAHVIFECSSTGYEQIEEDFYEVIDGGWIFGSTNVSFLIVFAFITANIENLF